MALADDILGAGHRVAGREARAGITHNNKVSRVTTPKLLPPPPLRAQNRSAFMQLFAMRTAPSAGNDFGLQQIGGGGAVILRKTAEPADLREAI
ncbi:MAG: hypothetical protein WA633_03675 [Stellaceae bacterium]